MSNPTQFVAHLRGQVLAIDTNVQSVIQDAVEFLEVLPPPAACRLPSDDPS